MEVVVTTEAIRRATLQLNRHHQQTNTQHFYSPDALPVARPTVSEHRRHRDTKEEKLSYLFLPLFTLFNQTEAES